jgi:hypothetical protein
MNIEHPTSNIEHRSGDDQRSTSNVQLPTSKEEEIQSAWFREPTRRERRIGAALFLGFGIFFSGLAWVQRGWWFAWVILGLAGISLWVAGRHAKVGFTAETQRREDAENEPQMHTDAH